ncbi:helix-turn-helix transcriptional regulator [Wenxinia marina]|uniref:Response regulator n=1 Tax=Wenxinia marina DSM 24838 TaxID=1123501 RepID=A0A0D0Q150_9RHOB|nr:LuxR C-terminal-related transcriptional regulator [Wenxinia marina]KIQ68284.1 Response regulator [Wenxinia marina DSM 24838]GGL79419.1 hypothetical protein GCM10011392_37340 [Wenxinia marina]
MGSAFDDAAPLVAAVGGPGFGAALMALLHGRAGADLCSVFTVDDGPPVTLVAESAAPGASPFARIASLRYVQRYWRRDTAALSTLGRAHRSVQVLKRPAGGIGDLDYQRECYGEGGVAERLSLYRAGRPAIIANAYRASATGRFEPGHIAAFTEMSGFLHAAIARHADLLSARPAAGPEDVARRLAGSGLSRREAEVAALHARGEEQGRIAERLGVAESSVVTYRRRACQKLGVSGRAQLRERLEGLTGPG